MASGVWARILDRLQVVDIELRKDHSRCQLLSAMIRDLEFTEYVFHIDMWTTRNDWQILCPCMSALFGSSLARMELCLDEGPDGTRCVPSKPLNKSRGPAPRP